MAKTFDLLLQAMGEFPELAVLVREPLERLGGDLGRTGLSEATHVPGSSGPRDKPMGGHRKSYFRLTSSPFVKAHDPWVGEGTSAPPN